MTKKWMEANGVSLRYELGGQGEELVVLVHELGGALDSWDEALPAFQRHFRTLRYDQRGCGLSEKVRGPIRIDDMVGDIAGLLDGLGIRAPCHVVGFALGSSFAMAFAARHPARVARLAVCSPVTGATAARRAFQAQRADMVQREGMRSCADQSLAISYPQVLRAARARFETYRSLWLASDPHCYAAMNRMLLDMDLSPELANISCPTLVLGAVHDAQRPPPLARSVAEQIRGARFAEIESGHFSAVQTPDLFAGHVVPFLRNQPAAS